MVQVSQGGDGVPFFLLLFFRLVWPKGLVLLMLVNNIVNTDTFTPEHSHLSGPGRENKYWWSGKGRGRVMKQHGSLLEMQTWD